MRLLEYPPIKAQNCTEVLGVVKTPEDGFIVLARETGPAGLVCWMMDADGNCFWGRYGSEARTWFDNRMKKLYTGEDK